MDVPLFAIVRNEICPQNRYWSETLYKYCQRYETYVRLAFKPIKVYHPKVNWEIRNPGDKLPLKWQEADKNATNYKSYTVLKKYTYPDKTTTFYNTLDEIGDEVVDLFVDLL